MQCNTKTIELLTAAKLRRLILYREHGNKFETVARIQDKHVAWLGVMVVCNSIGMCRFCRGVGNCDREPNFKGGQLHRFYCT